MSESDSAAEPSPQELGGPETPELAPVDWAAHRAELVEAGDNEGAELLDRLLASPRRGDRPWRGVIKQTNGERNREVVLPPLTDADILDALRNRRQIRKLRAELRPSLEADATTPAGVCAKWRMLAAWVPRFTCSRRGREVINFGGCVGPVTAKQMFPSAHGEDQSPELAWAEAFRETTKALVPLVLDERLDDVPVHHLLQDLDRVLDGEEVELAADVRQVELLVRIMATRREHPQVAGVARSAPEEAAKARAESNAKEAVARQREEDLVREHADSPWGSAMLKVLLRQNGRVPTAVLKRAGIAALEAQAVANAETDYETGREKHGRRIEETLRVMRDRCWKPAGCAPCADHLGLITSPTRGSNELTDKGRAIAEAQKRGER